MLSNYVAQQHILSTTIPFAKMNVLLSFTLGSSRREMQTTLAIAFAAHLPPL